MTARHISRRKGQPQENQQDKRLSRMVAISAVLHAAILILLVIFATRGQSVPTAPMAYTVELVNPAGLGTSIPSGTGRATAPRDSTKTEKPTPPPPRPAEKPPASVQEQKVARPAPPQEQVKPAETQKAAVKVEPEKVPTKQSEQKPEAKKLEPAPVAEKVVVKPEEKKPEPKKTEAKPTPEKTAPQPEPKKVATTSPPLPTTTNVANNPAGVSADERDKKILAALDRIRKQVQEREGASGGGSGSGPLTTGGAPGQGGGGAVRGLEFIMYTEQVKRRVKESWIVAEKKTGLSAVVRFGVQPDGHIFAVELLRPSGDRAFDESTLRAVRSASPLPPPPQAYVQEFATQKVEVSFGGEERSN
jgi:colicin import membrane protein